MTEILAYAGSSPDKPGEDFEVRSRLLELLAKYGHAPAYIFVLNFDSQNKKHQSHVFDGDRDRSCVGKNIIDETSHTEVEQLAYEDNAVLLLASGEIHTVNAQLVNVKPLVPENLKNEKLHHHFGFAISVHTRHYSSLGGSYHLPGSLIYTLGESGHVRRFQGGRITFSTVKQEPWRKEQ